MTDLLKAASTNLWAFVFAWFLPGLVAVSVFASFMFPHIATLPGARNIAAVSGESIAGLSAVLLVAVLATSVLLALSQRPLYRMLEGYLAWPESWYTKLRERHLQKRREVAAKVYAGPSEDLPKLKWQLAFERYAAYPEQEDDVLPTRLGNALKALETYGAERYGLDSQTYWYELLGVVPEPLRKDCEEARATVDFFISAIWYAILLGIAGIVIGLTLRQPEPAVVAVLALAATPLFYIRAVEEVGNWAASVRAAVHVGRVPLAKQAGLSLPPSLEEERMMWSSFTSFVVYGDADSAMALDAYRAVPAEASDVPVDKPGS